MSSAAAVSVVIPTLSRPDLVNRAVHSALAQTVKEIEVIVVVDGPDDATHSVLKEIGDPRLRVLGLPERGGAPIARNAGVSEARAPWVALLDDDDEWLAHKLAVQLDLARTTTMPLPIVASRLINRSPGADLVMPRRLPAVDEPISEYFLVRRGLFHGDGFIQTSTIMAPTELLRRVPFAVGVPRMQELDWTLRALTCPGVGLVMAAEPLVIWHTDENRPRISLAVPWEESFEWIRSRRPLFTPRAYAACLMSVIASMAAPSHSRSAFRTLLREAHEYGRPGALDYLTYAQIWLIPTQLRRRLRDLVLRGRRSPTAARAGMSEAR